MFYTLRKAPKVFQNSESHLRQPEEIKELARQKQIPSPHVDEEGDIRGRGYNTQDLPALGKHLGFLPPLESSQVISVFVTKGGVLKTTLTLNLARMAALHGLRTLVIGLDLQCDITTALGLDTSESMSDLDSALEQMDQTSGLSDYFFEKVDLQDIILNTDLSTLDVIPETPELVAMEQGLLHRPKREFWLKDKVINPLRSQYDLFVIDCSPNWNQLITNALCASDLLISPLECKINNYRNFQMFREFTNEFKEEMNLSLQHVYVPTRLTQSRKLSREIKDWYVKEISNCLPIPIRDSITGEEATAMHLSIPEYQPGSEAAKEINDILRLLWKRLKPSPSAQASNTHSNDSRTV